MTCDECKGVGKVVVCDACLDQSCWRGEWLCEKSRNAGVTTKDCPHCQGTGEKNEVKSISS